MCHLWQVSILVKTGWEGKVTEWDEAELNPSNRMVGFLCVCWIMSWFAAPSSAHKMAVEHCCYGNAPFKLPLHPRSEGAFSIIYPPHITPFQSASADSWISICHVGQRGSIAGALLCPDWQTRVLGRERARDRKKEKCGGGKKKFFNELMLRSNSMWELADRNFKLCLKFQTWVASQCSIKMVWRLPKVGRK